MNVLLINHRAEAMERQKVIADNTCASKINTCRPGLSVVEATRNFIPDFVILQTGGCSIYCLDTVDQLIENPQVYILLIAESGSGLLESPRCRVDDFISGMPSDSELILRVKMGLRCAAQSERRLGCKRSRRTRRDTGNAGPSCRRD